MHAWIRELVPEMDEGGATIEDPQRYVNRVQRSLPRWPAGVLLQWFHEHPHIIEAKSWLGYANLAFDLSCIDTAILLNSDVGDDGAIETYRGHFEAGRGARVRRTAEHFARAGTWPVPPIFLLNHDPTLKEPSGWPCSVPYYLLEGHHRMAALRSIAALGAMPLKTEHDVWLVRRDVVAS